MMEILFVRHGEAQSNIEPPENQTVGSNAPLTKEGAKQARAAARYLQQKAASGLLLSGTVWHSPLARARRTAQIIADELGKKTAAEPRLQEMRKGDWEGEKVADVIPRQASVPVDKKPFQRPPASDGSPPAENVLDMARRMADFIDELEKRNESPVVLVSHNHPIEALIGFLTNPDHRSDPAKWRVPSLKNGSITRLYMQDGAWKVDENIFNIVPRPSA